MLISAEYQDNQNIGDAWARRVFFRDVSVCRGDRGTTPGFSVRCVKDSTFCTIFVVIKEIKLQRSIHLKNEKDDTILFK